MRASDKKKNISSTNILLEMRHTIQKEELPESVELIARDIITNKQKIAKVDRVGHNVFKIRYNHNDRYSSIFTVENNEDVDYGYKGLDITPATDTNFISVDILLDGKVVHSDKTFFQDIFNNYLSKDIQDFIVNKHPGDIDSSVYDKPKSYDDYEWEDYNDYDEVRDGWEEKEYQDAKKRKQDAIDLDKSTDDYFS